jgi:hypothetical protein
VAGNYALGMLASFQDDLLGLSFDVQDFTFLNFRLNISAIDLDRFAGPFNATAGTTPVFDIILFDNPTGATTISGNGTALDSQRITGSFNTSRSVFDWTEHIVALDASNSTNGNVTIRIDLVSETGTSRYAAMDNFRIVASDTRGDIGIVPEPGSLALCGLGLGAALLAGLGRERSRRARLLDRGHRAA